MATACCRPPGTAANMKKLNQKKTRKREGGTSHPEWRSEEDYWSIDDAGRENAAGPSSGRALWAVVVAGRDDRRNSRRRSRRRRRQTLVYKYFVHAAPDSSSAYRT